MRSTGFTLAELLIALAILGVIATFTIPKILQSQGNQKNNAIAKEAVATISAAYQAYRLTQSVTTTTQINVVTPYLNYVKIDTSSSIDNIPGGSAINCNATDRCFMLHNGAAIWLWEGPYLGGTAATNAWIFVVDPDAKGNHAGEAVQFFLYYSGRTASLGTAAPNTYVDTFGPYNPDPTQDPSWFSW